MSELDYWHHLGQVQARLEEVTERVRRTKELTDHLQIMIEEGSERPRRAEERTRDVTFLNYLQNLQMILESALVIEGDITKQPHGTVTDSEIYGMVYPWFLRRWDNFPHLCNS